MTLETLTTYYTNENNEITHLRFNAYITNNNNNFHAIRMIITCFNFIEQ